MQSRLSLDQKIEIVEFFAQQWSLQPALILALMQKESGIEGFNPDGSLKINFEQNVFNMKAKWHWIFIEKYGKLQKVSNMTGSHPNKNHIEHEYLEKASKIHREHALNATGMGIMQTQGWEAFRLGYSNSEEMYEMYCKSEIEQIKAAFVFLQYSRGGRYPLFGPQIAPMNYIGPNLAAAYESQDTNNMLPIAIKYRGNPELARTRYAPKLAVMYDSWKRKLAGRKAESASYNSQGLVDYPHRRLPDIDWRRSKFMSELVDADTVIERLHKYIQEIKPSFRWP